MILLQSFDRLIMWWLIMSAFSLWSILARCGFTSSLHWFDTFMCVDLYYMVLNFLIATFFSGRDFITPCKCKGTSKYVHRECLDQWRAVRVFLHTTTFSLYWELILWLLHRTSIVCLYGLRISSNYYNYKNNVLNHKHHHH